MLRNELTKVHYLEMCIAYPSVSDAIESVLFKNTVNYPDTCNRFLWYKEYTRAVLHYRLRMSHTVAVIILMLFVLY